MGGCVSSDDQRRERVSALPTSRRSTSSNSGNVQSPTTRRVAKQPARSGDVRGGNNSRDNPLMSPSSTNSSVTADASHRQITSPTKAMFTNITFPDGDDAGCIEIRTSAHAADGAAATSNHSIGSSVEMELRGAFSPDARDGPLTVDPCYECNGAGALSDASHTPANLASVNVSVTSDRRSSFHVPLAPLSPKCVHQSPRATASPLSAAETGAPVQQKQPPPKTSVVHPISPASSPSHAGVLVLPHEALASFAFTMNRSATSESATSHTESESLTLELPLRAPRRDGCGGSGLHAVSPLSCMRKDQLVVMLEGGCDELKLETHTHTAVGDEEEGPTTSRAVRFGGVNELSITRCDEVVVTDELRFARSYQQDQHVAYVMRPKAALRSGGVEVNPESVGADAFDDHGSDDEECDTDDDDESGCQPPLTPELPTANAPPPSYGIVLMENIGDYGIDDENFSISSQALPEQHLQISV